MQIYRFLTGPSDSSFYHKVTKTLSEGWLHYGSPSILVGADGKAVCGQAVTRDAGEQAYDPDKKLTAY